jgi:hypothetical protein
MLGTTNTDASICEISFGSNALNDCAATRTMDTTASADASWHIAAEDYSIQRVTHLPLKEIAPQFSGKLMHPCAAFFDDPRIDLVPKTRGRNARTVGVAENVYVIEP